MTRAPPLALLALAGCRYDECSWVAEVCACDAEADCPGGSCIDSDASRRIYDQWAEAHRRFHGLSPDEFEDLTAVQSVDWNAEASAWWCGSPGRSTGF